ncbi:MAG: glycine cleavage system protein T, partial [Sphingomonadales bacterium]|nr:glycine cleavage system protein T [Sphingomonadales bacterium]
WGRVKANCFTGRTPAGLAPGRQRYSFLTNDGGGVLDDLMVANSGAALELVVNAACKADDLVHLRAKLPSDAGLEELPDLALLALQGPQAAAVLSRLDPAAAGMAFMESRELTLNGAACRVSRSGYTGEDGYEISVPGDAAEGLARRLLAHDDVAPIGLGARDSLRLEAGLCLYGHDIDETTSPIEAGLAFAVSKRRREAGDFPGARRILAELADGPGRRRVGLKPEGRAPVREGADIVDEEGTAIGRVTSGGYGPSVGGPVAMGYVDAASGEPGTPVGFLVRGKTLPGRVVALPFVTKSYKR